MNQEYGRLPEKLRLAIQESLSYRVIKSIIYCHADGLMVWTTEVETHIAVNDLCLSEYYDGEKDNHVTIYQLV